MPKLAPFSLPVTPACYSDAERFEWQTMAKKLLEEVEIESMSLEEFKEKIKIPEIKQ